MSNLTPQIAMSALFTTYISPSVESISIINDMVSMSRREIEDRILYAIQCRGYNRREMMEMTHYITGKTCMMDIALSEFETFSDDYNLRYPTRKKGYVSSIEAAFCQVKQITAPLRVLIQRFRQPANGTLREREAAGAGKDEALKSSYLTGAAYSGNLFPGEYPQCVSAFVSAVERYFAILDTTIDMIDKLLDGERELRGKPHICHHMLRVCVEECRKCYGFLYRTGKKTRIMREEMLEGVDDSLYREYVASADKDKFVTDNLHRWDDDDIRNFALHLMLGEAESIGATPEEQRLFGDNPTILAARRIVDGFDALFLDACPRKDVSLYVGLFCDWTGKSWTDAYRYFTARYRECGGKHKIVKCHAVSDTKRRPCWREKRELFRQKIAPCIEAGAEGGGDTMVVGMQPGGATPLSTTQCSGGLPRS